MGVDLSLYPIDSLHEIGSYERGLGKKWGFSHTVLTLPRNYGCWEALKRLPQIPIAEWDIAGLVGGRVPDGKAEGERMYGRFDTDPYGEPYHAVQARGLAPELRRFFPDHPSTAYIGALPPDHLVVLGWH